ncbi:MAG: NAD-dependent epimerase/dehydratase family protein [Cyanobium sp.]
MIMHHERPCEGKFLLTGASGWFGRTALWEYEQHYGPGALRRDVIAFASCAKSIDFGSRYGPISALPLSSITTIANPRGLIHLAFLTRDRLQHVDIDRYITLNREIRHQIEHLICQYPQMPIITMSSGAAAALDPSSIPDLGDDPYASLKREEEALWRSHSQGRMALVFRVYAASGRFLKSPKLFALGDFVEKALAGQRIVINSRRLVVRSYVHVGTLMRLCWQLLRQPLPSGFAQIDACTNTLTLIELAEIISNIWKLPMPKHELDQSLGSDEYTADSSAFRELLQKYGLKSPELKEQIYDTALAFAEDPEALRHETDETRKILSNSHDIDT